MNYHRYFATGRPPVETAIVGTGSFGRSFLLQAQHMKAVNARIAVDVDSVAAAAALRAVGIPAERIRRCETAEQAAAAWAAGHFLAAGDLAWVVDLPIDVVIEATGHPEAGARHGELAIAAGRHLVLVSKEVDSVVGPELARRAREKGVVVTPVDGDQPSLLIGLISWAEVLGFEIVAAGKSSEYDFVLDAAEEAITSNGRTVPASGFACLGRLGDSAARERVAARSRAAAALPQRAVPDLCELLLVANATGLSFDRPDLHAPIARIDEVASLLCPAEDGGLLAGTGRLDVFHCLRGAHEVSAAGGVFVVVRCTDKDTWRILAEKGHLVSRTGNHATILLPRHLLGLEAATSVFEAAIHGASTGAAAPKPRYDLVARAERDLPAGTVLAMGGHHHTIDGLGAELQPAAPLSAAAPAPFYLAANQRLIRAVRQGALVTMADIEVASGSVLLALRQAQDAAFFGPSAAA